MEARKGARARCRCCGKPGPVYDTRSQPRRWRFISVWAIAVFLVYRPRRVECPRCGVHVEHLPWASGKLQLCDALRLFLAQWARLLSWQEVFLDPEMNGAIWFWLAGPKGLPAPIVTRLNEEMRRLIASAETRQLFEKSALLSLDADSPRLTGFIAEEVKRWRAFVEEKGLKK